MRPYAGDDAHEREPLDSYHAYNEPNHRPPPPSHAYSQSPPHRPYYDASLQHHADMSASGGRGTEYDAYESPYDNAEPPPPPRHGDNTYYQRSRPGHAQPVAQNTVTPGADNFSETASGGMAGIAYGVAERNARDSGMDAIHPTGQLPPPPSHGQYPNVPRQTYSHSPRNSYIHESDQHLRGGLNPLGMAATSASSRSPSRSPGSFPNHSDPYVDDPYQAYSSTPRNGGSMLGVVNPNEIEDDGDDGLDYSRNSQRNSMMSGNHSDRAAKAGVAGAGGAAAAGGLLAHKGYYGGGAGDSGSNGGNSGGRDVEYDMATGQEKSDNWLAKQNAKSKRWKWFIIILIFLIIAGAVAGGVAGSFIANNKHKGGGGGGGGGGKGKGKSAEDDAKQNGDLGIGSSEIKDLLKNPDLHKVFPGMDYTPLNTQYPDCMHNPPSQNNITRDVAVLSQLTNKIRLYGTDCNQTQMLVHAVRQLEMTKDIKIWLGVWQDNNATTNARQLDQMWQILDEYGEEPFEGIIVANEVLFRKELTITQLGSIMDEVRTNLTKKNFNLPVATSDLGDDWTAELAADSDYIMANVHPFFSGTPADEAAGWTYDFWVNKDGPFWKKDKKKNIISETGWPTGGGKNCGGGPVGCASPAVAGVDELNQFMDDWVCAALKNGTNYFWFEAFDEPWKVRFNEKGREWEDKWGLLDVDRNLKKGVKIPDCGGTTVS